MHYCSTNHRGIRRPVTLYGQPIKHKNSMCILGVTFDRGLTFKQHFATTKKNCQTRINLLKAVSGRRVSGSRAVRLKVAKAILDSKLLYGLEIICLAQTTLIDTLSPTYNTSRRIVSNLLPSTPTLESSKFQRKIIPW